MIYIYIYIITKEFNTLTSENFPARLAHANLASKTNISNFVKRTDFQDRLKNLNKNVISNEAEQVLVENELNELSKNIELISTKGLTKYLINGYKSLNEANFFFRNISNLFSIYTS